MTGKVTMKTDSAMSVPTFVPVIVIGGGPIGSALSIELRLRGIDVLVVERDAEIREGHPKARSNNMRTLEHYRRWGISDALRKHAWTTRDPEQRLVIAESLVSEPLGAFPLRYGRHAEESWQLAAEPSLSVPQPVTMRILRGRSIELGARWRTRLLGGQPGRGSRHHYVARTGWHFAHGPLRLCRGLRRSQQSRAPLGWDRSQRRRAVAPPDELRGA
jgi:hypothetical protein